MRRTRITALLAVVALLLSACSSLPRSGEVHAANPSPTQGGNIGLVGHPPPEDATPEQIITGFLAACRAGVEDDFAVARQYLMRSASADWDPAAQVRVYPDNQNIQTSRTATGGVRARVGSLGTLSSTGVYTESANDAVSVADFSLAKNQDGQWRIVSLDDGIFLAEHMFFDQLYVESPVYFLSPDSDALVADLHWFPRRDAPTRAINALLEGPSQWLADGVTTAIPEDTTLTKQVQVQDGVASIELSANVLSMPQRQRSNMVAQVRRTLMASNSIQSVEISVQGQVLETDLVPDLAEYPYGSFPLSVLADGVPATVVDGQTVPVIEDSTVGELGLSALAVGYQNTSSRYAALAREGSSLVAIDSASGTYETLLPGANLIEPSFDSLEWIWSGEKTNTGYLSVARFGGTGPLQVGASWLQGMSVRDIAVSREGSRIVIVAETGGELSVFVSSISRAADGTPVSLGDPIRVGQRLSDITEVSWVDATELLVLGRTAAGSDMSLYSLHIGGPTSRVFGVETGTVSLTTGRGEQSAVILTDSGSVIGRTGGAWRNLATSVSAVAYPG
ncbi:LpqB family beta-propeller domain-containing protein [Actinomycetaceae bacterium L2_0104]